MRGESQGYSNTAGLAELSDYSICISESRASRNSIIPPAELKLCREMKRKKNRHFAVEQQRTELRENKCEEIGQHTANRDIRVKSDTFHHIVLI